MPDRKGPGLLCLHRVAHQVANALNPGLEKPAFQIVRVNALSRGDHDGPPVTHPVHRDYRTGIRIVKVRQSQAIRADGPAVDGLVKGNADVLAQRELSVCRLGLAQNLRGVPVDRTLHGTRIASAAGALSVSPEFVHAVSQLWFGRPQDVRLHLAQGIGRYIGPLGRALKLSPETPVLGSHALDGGLLADLKLIVGQPHFQRIARILIRLVENPSRFGPHELDVAAGSLKTDVEVQRIGKIQGSAGSSLPDVPLALGINHHGQAIVAVACRPAVHGQGDKLGVVVGVAVDVVYQSLIQPHAVALDYRSIRIPGGYLAQFVYPGIVCGAQVVDAQIYNRRLIGR